MKLVTVATTSDGLFPVLVEGCKRHGYDLQVLGWGQKWRGFSWRWTLLEAYLLTLPRNELVVWTDAYDVIPVKSAADTVQRFKEYGKPLLFSVETENVDWMTGYVRNRVFGKCMKGVHLNGGVYMGEAWAILEMIGALRSRFGFRDADDDQRLLHKGCTLPYFKKHATIDTHSRIFYNAEVHQSNPLKRSTRQVVWGPHIDTCFVHGNNNADLTAVMHDQGYTVPTASYRDDDAYAWGVAKHFAPSFIPEVIACLVILYFVYWKFF